MPTWGRRWVFFFYMTVGAIGSGYAAAVHVGDASTRFRIAGAMVVLAGVVVGGICVYRVTGDRAARIQRGVPRRGAASTTGVVVTLSAALSGASSGWELLVFTASCAICLAFAASLPFIDRELRRRETADREWSAQRPRGGR